MSISSTASSALRPLQGEPAECALRPWKVNWVEMRPEPPGPPEVTKSLETWLLSITSTSRNRPAFTMCVRLASSSSATPGYTRMVPGILCFCIRFFTTTAAVTFTASPVLWPSPWPGPPGMSGA